MVRCPGRLSLIVLIWCLLMSHGNRQGLAGCDNVYCAGLEVRSSLVIRAHYSKRSVTTVLVARVRLEGVVKNKLLHGFRDKEAWNRPAQRANRFCLEEWRYSSPPSPRTACSALRLLRARVGVSLDCKPDPVLTTDS